MKQKILKLIGITGVVACILLFAINPSFPTPDKILIFLVFVFMIFGQALSMLKILLPFVLILLAYESFRGIADDLNHRVNFMWMVDVDKWLFGGRLPTVIMQNWWWHGQALWYDFIFYVPYMLHFVLPFTLAVIVWKFKKPKYWQVVVSYILVSYIGFFTFLAFPAAPPWMASDLGYIESIHRISSDVWGALGIKDFPSLYNQVSPNAVAAVPSLHAAYATLFALWVVRLFKTCWKYIAWVYPVLIYIGTVYQGEHYMIDEILGALLAVAVFYATPFVLRKTVAVYTKFKKLCLKQ